MYEPSTATALPVLEYDAEPAHLRAHGYCICPLGSGDVVSAWQFFGLD